MERIEYKIPRLKKFKIKFEGIEPIFCYTYKTSSHHTAHIERGLFSPIHHLVNKFKLRMQFYDFKKLGVKPEKCEQGDGE